MENIKKAWSILLSSEKKILTFLVLIKIIGMGLEIFGIALIIPLISVLLKKNTEFFNLDISSFFGNINSENIVTLLVILIIFAYLVKNSFLMFLAWIDTKFAYGVAARLSKDLFKGYVNLPYYFHLKKNTSKLIYNVTTSVEIFKSALYHMSILFSEFFVLIGLSIFLIFIEPFGFLCASLLISLISLMYYRIHRAKIANWGEKTQLHQKLKIKNLMQGLGAIKDIIILGLQDFFVETYNVHNIETAKMGRKNDVVNQFPKFVLEIFGVTGILTLLLILNHKISNVDNIVVILGVFAAASFRLMPSANRIINALQGFKFAIASVDNLSSEFELVNKYSGLTNKKVHEKSEENQLINFKKFNLVNINYKYPGSNKNILEKISLTINRGEMLGIFGKTGSGKSTLVDIVTGLLNLDSGEIFINEKKFKKIPVFWQRNIGYVPQNIYLLDDTLKKNIALGVDNKNLNELKINELINFLDLKELVNTLPEGLNSEVGERGTRLSGGEKQRIGMARALYHNPQVLIFDEATNALDVKTEESIMSTIQKLRGEKIVLIISHKKVTLSFCDKILELKNGNLIESSLDSLTVKDN